MTLYESTPSWNKLFQAGFVPFFVLSHNDETDSFQQTDELLPIVFDKGRVLVNHFTVTKAQFSQQSIAWAHQSDRGFTGGNLIYAKSGTELHGVVSIGDDPTTATESYVFATAIPLSEYATTLAGTEGSQDGPVLRIGMRARQGLAPSISVFLNGLDVTHATVQSLEAETGRPVLDISIPKSPDLPGASGAAHIAFDIGDDGAVSFSGSIIAIGDGATVTVSTWTGERRESPAVGSARIEAETQALAFVDAVLPSGESALTEAELESPEISSAILSLLNKRPDDNDVSNASNDYMMENMKYAMTLDPSDDEVTSRRKWMEIYFREQRPTITDPKRIATITKDAAWYRDTMATAILGNSVANQVFDSKVVPRPVSAAQKDMLKDYVQKALGADKTYGEQQQAVWRTVYFDRAPSLKVYAEEDRVKLVARAPNAPRPTDWDSMTWAERVLEYSTAPKQFQIITDNLMTGTGTVGGDVSAEEEAIEAAKTELAEAEADLPTAESDLAEAQSAIPPNAKDIARAQRTVNALKALISNSKATIASLEKQKADRQARALLTMRNVSSVLYAFDEKGDLSQTYMDGVGMAYLAKSLESTDISLIDNYEETLTDYLTRYLDDLANNRKTPFGSINETGDINDLLRDEALSSKQLASLMVQALVNARQPSFIATANTATDSFTQKYPKLSGVFRVGLIAGYIFTFLKALELVQKGTGSATTFEKVTTYGTFASLMVETVRSLLPNVKGLFKSIFKSMFQSETLNISGQPGVFSRFFSAVGRGIAGGVMRVVDGVRATVGKVSEAVLKNPLFAAVRNFFARMVGAVGRAVQWVRGTIVGGISGLIARIAASPRWASFANFMGKAFGVIAKGLMVISSVWTAVTEGIAMVKVWQTSQSGWHKALATMQFAAIALSTVATVIGVFSTAVAWSAAGAVLALVALGIGLLISYLWPPESTIQKMITRVFVPFIDGKATTAVKAVNDAEDQPVLENAEDELAFGGAVAA